MGRNKAIGPDEIPIEAWKCLGGEGERVIERRLRRETEVSEIQFGFMPGRSTMEAIHIIKILMEKYKERQKDLHLAFLDLKKAYDSVPRELIWKTLSDKGTPMRYIKVFQECKLRAKDLCALPTTKKTQKTLEGLNGRLEQWIKALEDNGLRVNKEKTKYLRCNFSRNENGQNEEEEICIGKHILEPKESFRYLRSMIHKSGRIEDDVTHRIQVGWLKWRSTTGIMCDNKVPLKLKGKFYRVAIRPAMLYGSECWPLTKVQANRMEVAEMRMLRWTCGKTILDMLPNGVFRTNLQVVNIVNKMREGRLRWFGHVKRRPQSAPVRRVEPLTVNGARRRGRPKLRSFLPIGFLALRLFAPLLSFFPMSVACLFFYVLFCVCFSACLPVSLLLCRYVPLPMPACLVFGFFACLLLSFAPVFRFLSRVVSFDALYLGGGLSGSSPSTLGYGFYVDAEEYELGDLNEPPNYKAALSDPEFDKWPKAMNTEMQSIKDN
ncbi:retrovirus-related pol polyprotein LINE-1 [Tanacetum coccineum]